MPGRIVKLIKFAICFCFLLIVFVAIVSAWPLKIYAYCIFNCNLNNSQVKRTIKMRYGLSSLNRSFSSNKMLPDNLPHSHTHTHTTHKLFPSRPLRQPFDSKLAGPRACGPVRLASGQWQLPLPFTNLHSIRRQLAASNRVLPRLCPTPCRLPGDWTLLFLKLRQFKQMLWNSVEAVAANKEIRLKILIK